MIQYQHPEGSGFRLATTSQEFKAAAYNELYDGAIMLMPVDEALQKAITAYSQQIGIDGQFQLRVINGVVKLHDPQKLCMPALTDRIELLAQNYHEMTGFSELVVHARKSCNLWEHDHPYEVGNMVLDVVDTNNSDEIGTTFRERNGGWLVAPLSAFTFFKRNVSHSGTRMTDSGLTILVRPTDHYVGCNFY